MTAMARARVEGSWYNELGSHLELATGDDGRLTGTFCSPVGGDDRPQPVTGFVDLAPPDGTAVLGFTVSWPATHSLSVWAGRCDLEQQVIETTWLLASELRQDEAWHSTLVGHNRFTRHAVVTESHAPLSDAQLPG
jgi:hypothetical protein